ncbi:MAG: UDP-N-acetylglucosamine--N-acetylmuramyl-(pentapeptide) pyrophosphoryl-undecaprenol N-acetylglucosamine transferase [Actinomycetales bacterium]|nr:MAG: UDP-N-acetylglucosamine--N-acetylmuramyl-(pentapeptide) pyrophosphoryl-undecaprenol N-acetylglucosamine transferase [Actinomycetales bacterium]
MATIVLAGGGTAGHIEPALAVARAWRGVHPEDLIVFIGTEDGLENTIIPAAGFTVTQIPKVAVARRPSLTWLRVPVQLFSAVRASRIILRDADLLIGFGGYVSAPTYLAARITGLPTVIHEANAKPGWANRLGALMTPYVAVANPVDSREFTDALLTGMPLRSDVAAAFVASRSDFQGARIGAKKRLGFDEKAPLIFIMGGSQGSVAINKEISGALPALLSKGLSILHSVGRANPLPKAEGAYHPVAYVDAMADAYLASDLIIARSGAVTCSEFRALGRYALFVPLPIGNGEQFLNARTLVADKRAQLLEQSQFTSAYLIEHIDELLTSSAAAPPDGSSLDLDAAEKIVALGEFAISAR